MLDMIDPVEFSDVFDGHRPHEHIAPAGSPRVGDCTISLLGRRNCRRAPTWCQHMTEYWQTTVLDQLAERMISPRAHRPVAFVTFGHWGPFAYVENWGGLSTARFANEASMLSWLIAS